MTDQRQLELPSNAYKPPGNRGTDATEHDVSPHGVRIGIDDSADHRHVQIGVNGRIELSYTGGEGAFGIAHHRVTTSLLLYRC